MSKSTHLYHYLVLILGLLASFASFIYFRHNPAYQMTCAFGGCVFYSAWGIIHGFLEQRLNWHIAFEYITISLFVLALLFASLSLK